MVEFVDYCRKTLNKNIKYSSKKIGVVFKKLLVLSNHQTP